MLPVECQTLGRLARRPGAGVSVTGAVRHVDCTKQNNDYDSYDDYLHLDTFAEVVEGGVLYWILTEPCVLVVGGDVKVGVSMRGAQEAAVGTPRSAAVV